MIIKKNVKSGTSLCGFFGLNCLIYLPLWKFHHDIMTVSDPGVFLVGIWHLLTVEFMSCLQTDKMVRSWTVKLIKSHWGEK